jgi:hypothetical protein
MQIVDLYFQYTHLSNADLNKMRTYLSSFKVTMNILSATDLPFVSEHYVFGKLLRIRVGLSSLHDSFIDSLLSMFPSLKLLFIYFNSFIFTPALFKSFIIKYKSYDHKGLFMLFGYSLSSLRLITYQLKVLLLTIILRFKEICIAKYSAKYIC